MLNKMFTIIEDFGSLFLRGIMTTIELAFLGTFIGFLIALVLCIMRIQTVNPNDSRFTKILKKISSGFVKVYVTVFRGTPMMVQAIIFYYSFYEIGIRWSPFEAGLFTISLNTAAYLAEVLRGGIESVDRGQYEAARSIGMSGIKSYIFVVFPQAIKNSFASIGNELIVNIKDSSVLSLIAVVDLFNIADRAAGKYYWFVESMLIAAAIYLVLTYVTAKILFVIEKKMDIQTKDIVSSN